MNRLACLLLLVAPAASALPAQAVIAYHGASAAYHAGQAATLPGQGYRPLSLSIAGTSTAPTISATWIQRPGPSFAMSAPMNATNFGNWRIQQLVAGRRPLVIAAEGSGSTTTYMGVWVSDSVSSNYVIDVSRSSFEAACDTARANGRWLTSVTMHGSIFAQRYSAVFEDNPDDVAWGYHIAGTGTEFGQQKTAHQEGQVRPYCIASSVWGPYTSVWRDDRIGSWELVWGQTAAAYQNAFNVYTSGGFYPVAIASHGGGANARYSAIFVQSDTPLTRIPTTTGPNPALLAGFNTYMQNHLQAYGARAGTLAITKNGRLVFARGYTRAEPGYPVTQPTDRFRLASLSKPITAAAVHRIVQQGTPTVLTTAQSYLNYPFFDARYPTITLDNLLRHTSGLIGNVEPWSVANWWSPANPILPTTAFRSARYVASHSLDFTPGTYNNYSNHGYITLGRFVESYTGGSYFNYVNNQVLQPLSITQGVVGAPNRSQLASNEVFYHLDEVFLEPSNLHTDRRPKTPQYNRDCARMDSSGGLVMSAVDYARMLAGIYDGGGDEQVVTAATAGWMRIPVTHPNWTGGGTSTLSGAGMTYTDLGNGVKSYSKGGTLRGVSTRAIYRTDGVCIAAFVNKTFAHASTAQLNSLANVVTSWPTTDLFPVHGYPPFAYSCPRLTNTVVGTLPNLTDGAFVFDGERLDLVESVLFNGQTIISQSQSSWADGWFEKVSPTRIEIHPPQGLAPGSHVLSVASLACSSPPVVVTIQLAATARVRAADQPVGAFEAIASRGPNSAQTLALLGIAFDNLPTTFPGVVSLGIGNNGTSLLVWPGAIGADPVSGVFRWPVPDLTGFPTMYLQVALFDPLAPNPLPLVTTNVEVVTP